MLKVLINNVEYVRRAEQPQPSTMTEQESIRLREVLDHKGLDYSFWGYSNFDGGRNKIDGQRFHQLRRRYLDARQELMEYLEEKRALPL